MNRRFSIAGGSALVAGVRVLIVEDEDKLARVLSGGLREQGFAVDIAADGEEALWRGSEVPYDLILLDVMIPRMDGFEVLRRLRSAGCCSKVILLTARDGFQDRIAGLDLGADDYVVKPFDFGELLARMRVQLRNPGVAPVDQVLRCGDLELDVRSREARRGGQPLSLPTKQFALLEYLARRMGAVVSRAELAEHVWDENFDPFSNVIDVTVHKLRERLEQGEAPRVLHTIRGAGYVLRAPESDRKAGSEGIT